jgi:hypothetical protein
MSILSGWMVATIYCDDVFIFTVIALGADFADALVAGSRLNCGNEFAFALV